MFLKKLVMGTLFLVAGNMAHSACRPEIVALSKQYESPLKTNELSEKVALMLWVLLRHPEIDDTTIDIGSVVELDGSKMLEKRLPVFLAMQRYGNGRLKKAPMVVWASGFYSDHNTEHRNAKLLYAHGYHVMKVPTLWSTAFQALNPDFELGDFHSESLSLLQSLEGLLGAYKQSQVVTKLHWLGESYGAVLGAHVARNDSKSEEPLFDGTFYLAAPENDLKYAIDVFDSFFTKQKDYLDGFLTPATLLKHAAKYNRSESFADLNAKDIEMSFAMTGYGMHERMRKLMEFVDPKFKRFLKKNYDSKYDFTHTELIKNYSDPELLKQLDFLSIYKEVEEKKPQALCVLTSNDDFLNKENVWDKVKGQMLYLKGASHFGFLQDKFYTDLFLGKAFPKQ